MANTEEAEELAAALLASVTLMHPVYGSTSGWVGGIGGQAMTQGCSFIDPPHGDYMLPDRVAEVLREWLRANEESAQRVMERAERLVKGGG